MSRSSRRTIASRLIFVWPVFPLMFLACLASTASGQTRSSPAGADNAASARDAEIRELRRQLQDLTRRLDALEHGAPAKIASSTAPTLAKPAAPAAQPISPPAPAPTQAAEPQVTEEELGRALQTTLLQRHVLVLPPWAIQVTPDAFYEHQRTSGLTTVPLAGGVFGVANQDVRVDALGADVTLRLGLPYDAQAELVVPYEYERVRTVLAGTPQATEISGLGDIQLLLSKQVLAESESRPGVLASFGWKTATGKTAPAPATVLAMPTGTPLSTSAPILSLGTGFNSLTGALTASTRQDPMIFYGTASYTANLPGRPAGVRIDPGNTFGFAVGAALAVTPQTSLSADFATGFTAEDKANGVKIPGSDQVVGIFELGVATVITPKLVLNAGLGFGVTKDAPDFIFNLAVPYRF